MNKRELIDFWQDFLLAAKAFIFNTDDEDIIDAAWKLTHTKDLKFTPSRYSQRVRREDGGFGWDYVWVYDVEPEFAGEWIEYHLYGDYTSKAGLLDKSNMEQYEQALKPFEDSEDVIWRHGAYYSVNVAIHVWHNWRITDAFKAFWELYEQEEGYPLLNEEHYSNLEMEATHENIMDGLRYIERKGFLLRENKLPHKEDGVTDWDKLAYCVENFLSRQTDKYPSEAIFRYCLESVDDQGAYPSDEVLQAALIRMNLGYMEVDEDE